MDDTPTDLITNSLAFLEVTRAKVTQLSQEHQLYFSPRLSRLEQKFIQAETGEVGRLRVLSDELLELAKDLSSVLMEKRYTSYLSKNVTKSS